MSADIPRPFVCRVQKRGHHALSRQIPKPNQTEPKRNESLASSAALIKAGWDGIKLYTDRGVADHELEPGRARAFAVPRDVVWKPAERDPDNDVEAHTKKPTKLIKCLVFFFLELGHLRDKEAAEIVDARGYGYE
jgi:hypothetical protein